MSINIIGAAGGGSAFTRAEILTTSGTWTHPDGASTSSPKTVYAIISGGGAGGSGGSRANPSSTSTASMSGLGAGGASGTVVEGFVQITGPISYTIGSGGTGGTGASGSGSDTAGGGNSGNAGGNTNFGNLYAIGGGGNTIYGFRAASSLSGYIAASGSPSGATYPSLGGSLGASDFTGSHQTGTSGARSHSGQGSAPNNGFFVTGTPYPYSTSSLYTGQANPMTFWSVSATGIQLSQSSYYPYPGRTALVAGGGGAGAWGQTSGSNYTNTSIGSGGNGYLGIGGNGGNQLFATSGNVTGQAGQNGTGYGSGGGGGGSAIAIGSNTATGGAGGNGANGVVILLY